MANPNGPIRALSSRASAAARAACAVVAVTLTAGLASGCRAQPSAGGGCSVANASCAFVASLMPQREGYGRAATGGMNGPVVVIDSEADAGPGSLRAAVEGARGPLWVRFGRDVTIPLRSEIRARPDLTIDGRGHMVTLTDYGVLVRGASNVILTHLTIDGRSETLGQAVVVDMGAHDVWLDHLDLSRFNDRLIDVKKGATDVTLSWIKFHDDNKVMLLNNILNGPENPKDLFKTFDRDAGSRVTLHHNYFVDTVQRNPKGIFGIYHLYDNVLENWDFYGMAFSLEAKVLLEGNVFDNSASRPCREPAFFATIEHTNNNYCGDISKASPRAVLPVPPDEQRQYDEANAAYHYTHEVNAFMMLRDNLALHDARVMVGDYKPERVPPPPYCYAYQSPSVGLEDEVRRMAGNTPYDTTLPKGRCPRGAT